MTGRRVKQWRKHLGAKRVAAEELFDLGQILGGGVVQDVVDDLLQHLLAVCQQLFVVGHDKRHQAVSRQRR